MDRLSEFDWLQHGLKTLSYSGYVGLKADLMAKSLGVSRGSFYWHFKSLAAFKARLLEHWRETTTEQIIEDIERNKKLQNPLEDLMSRAFLGKTFGKLDQAVRHWAKYDPKAAEQLLAVDVMRIEYLTKLLKNRGLGVKDASSRARFIYSASLGNVQLPDGAGSKFTRSQIQKLVGVLQS